MQDKVIFNKKGEKSTFIIQVQYKQNSTWQGEVIWVEENRRQNFRSALELIKLMDGVLKETEESENEELGGLLIG